MNIRRRFRHSCILPLNLCAEQKSDNSKLVTLILVKYNSVQIAHFFTKAAQISQLRDMKMPSENSHFPSPKKQTLALWVKTKPAAQLCKQNGRWSPGRSLRRLRRAHTRAHRHAREPVPLPPAPQALPSRGSARGGGAVFTEAPSWPSG